MKVVWTKEAELSFAEVLVRVEHFGGPAARERLLDRVDRRTSTIERHPWSGRVVPEINVREIREVIEPPYRIVYRIRGDEIESTSFLHGSRGLAE